MDGTKNSHRVFPTQVWLSRNLLFCLCLYKILQLSLLPFSNTSTLEATVWRRRLLRKVLSWLRYVMPCRCTPRAPTLWSKCSSRPNTPKVSPDSSRNLLESSHSGCTWPAILLNVSSVHSGMGIRITGSEKSQPDRGAPSSFHSSQSSHNWFQVNRCSTSVNHWSGNSLIMCVLQVPGWRSRLERLCCRSTRCLGRSARSTSEVRTWQKHKELTDNKKHSQEPKTQKLMLVVRVSAWSLVLTRRWTRHLWTL